MPQSHFFPSPYLKPVFYDQPNGQLRLEWSRQLEREVNCYPPESKFSRQNKSLLITDHCYVAGTVASNLHRKVSYLILATSLKRRHCYSHFTGQKTVNQRLNNLSMSQDSNIKAQVHSIPLHCLSLDSAKPGEAKKIELPVSPTALTPYSPMAPSVTSGFCRGLMCLS